MRISKIAVAFGICISGFCQTGVLMSGSASRSDNGVPGISFSYQTKLEPPTPSMAGGIGGGSTSDKGGFHRFMTYGAEKKYFGYDLAIDPLPGNTFRVTFRPLSIGPDKMRNISDPAAWSMLPLPGYPAAQTVRSGDVIELDLFVNPSTGQKVVDYIQVGTSGGVTGPPGQLRDFSVHDVEMRFMMPRVIVNGKPADPNNPMVKGETVGPVVWFYLPNHGRYAMTLAPDPAYRKAGEIQGGTANFSLDGDTVAITCPRPIAPGSGPFNLYVSHDPAWTPADWASRESFQFGVTRPDAVIDDKLR